MKSKLKLYLKLFSLCFICCLAFSGCRKQEKNETASEELKEASIDVFAMDTYMTLKAYGDQPDEVLKKAEKEIKRLDNLWSTGNEDSEIYQLNEKKTAKVSDETISLIKKAQRIWKESDGAFDITIYPLMKLWGFPTEKYQVPEDQQIKQLMNTSLHMEKMKIDETQNEVSIGSEMEIDLGGIAKGYTSQKISELFQKYGIKHGIISLGGNVHAIGNKTDGSRWKVGIQSPVESMDMVGTYEASGEAVITSGGYERYFEKNGKTYHHILDPSTGKPAESGLISVTIVSKDGTLADGLSTTLFVMGKEKAEAYWRKHSKEFNMILVDSKSKIYVSEGIQKYFTSEYDYEVIKK